ncbi:hypothetical protein [Clostridium sp.]|uniref:hypothetical protein n=1 Tax=Clostridium sp. TaxID=1506 RepID=UPI002902E93E|nr:hypothetical protein [Clostridium sp.]MDU7259497.1 hypothetical protein [Clostridium butyricum]MDU1069902.1 hypothetical protein [Clostridium sp.]MDU2677792.1 hypothetical protein [Clostridium sp.]MDU4213818.1 hypothetical protein [Clostridium sp.]MDU5173778.1 hypothetical protein [Clostridium sp.]
MDKQKGQLVRIKLNMLLKRRTTFEEIEKYTILNKQMLYLFWKDKIDLDEYLLDDLYEVLKTM